jgi:hypothetical protein
MELESGFRVTGKLPQHHNIKLHGLDVIVEWPRGSVREGKDKDGKSWRREMKADYGFVDDTSAKGDKEPLDVYIGPSRDSEKAYIVEQLKEDGETLDEYKAVLGCNSLEEAQALYLAHYPKGWGDKRLGDVYETSLDELRPAIEENREAVKESPGVEDEEKEEDGASKEEAMADGAESGGIGTRLTGFAGHGPATCMNCRFRTPHSEDEGGNEVDSCSHPKVMADPDIKPEKKLPDGTVKVDYDDWCRFFHPPEGEGEDEDKEEGAGQEIRASSACEIIGSSYIKTLRFMD